MRIILCLEVTESHSLHVHIYIPNWSRCRTWFGADGKVSIERWYLSPYVKKPFNSKVIKSFVPELRSRQVFFFCVSGFLCYIYMCVMDIMNVLRTGMNMSISRIHIWLCNTWSHLSHPVSWGNRIHRLHHPQWYDTKQSHGEARVLELWGMWSTTSLPLLLGPPWPGVVAPNRVLTLWVK